MLRDGSLRELVLEGEGEDDDILTAEAYTIPESADALGKSKLTLKRWIRDKLIPPPVFIDTTHGYMQYTRTELQLIAKHLVEHEKEYDYLHYTHTAVINRIWQAVEANRK